MKRNLSKLFACVLAACSVGSMIGFAGCGTTTAGEKIDKTKTQLYVFNFNGGYGTEWLTYVKDRYEELHKDDVWEEGKKGVQIFITANKANAQNSATSVLTGRDEVFFQEFAYYYQLKSMGILGDITEAVTASIEEDGRSIEDKLTPQQKAHYGILEADGKTHYYGIPHYQTYGGLMYNIDLFEKRGYYFVNDPQGTNIEDLFVYYPDDVKSAGPDGQLGTYDDGLPATYDEFFTLCEYIAQTGDSIPVLWSGQHGGDYLNMITRGLFADYEGKEQFMLNFDYEGVATSLGTIVDGEFVKDATSTTITTENGYEVGRQAGRYYAATFLERLMTTKRYQGPNANNSTHSHLDAQDDFLYAGVDGETPETAMLVEGIWWCEEAQQTFEDMEVSYGQEYAMKNRGFGLMPWPKATADKVGEKQTLYDFEFSMCFMKPNIAEWKKPLALDFIKFANTDESLVEFTQVTSTPKALEYTMTEAQEAKLTPFGRSVWELKKSADTVYPISNKSFYANNQLYFTNLLTATVNNYTNTFSTSFLNGTATAAEYFKGIYTYRKDTWRTLN